MGQVKNLLIAIADDAAEITLDNCPGRGLPFSLQVSNAAELKAEVEGIAWEAFQTVFFEHANSTLPWDDLNQFNDDGDEVLMQEFDSFWNNFWEWNHERLIKSYGFEL